MEGGDFIQISVLISCSNTLILTNKVFTIKINFFRQNSIYLHDFSGPTVGTLRIPDVKGRDMIPGRTNLKMNFSELVDLRVLSTGNFFV